MKPYYEHGGIQIYHGDFGPNGNMFYTSNAQREDMIRAMQEFIQKFRAN